LHYTVYRTTCLLNGKSYVGKHQTTNLADGYQGSGRLLRAALAKYGVENFVTVVLGVYSTATEMNTAEKILVVCDPETSYNLCPGGHGGWGYINSNKLNLDFSVLPKAVMCAARASGGRGLSKRLRQDPALKEAVRVARARFGEHNPQFGKPSWNKGKPHSPEHRARIRAAALLRSAVNKV